MAGVGYGRGPRVGRQPEPQAQDPYPGGWWETWFPWARSPDPDT